MVRLGTGASIDPNGLDKSVSRLKALGFTAVQAGTLPSWSEEELQRIRRVLDAHGIMIGELANYQRGLVSSDPKARSEGVEAFKVTIRHAATLGAHCAGISWSTRCYPGPGWAHRENRSEETWRLFVDSARQLMEEAEFRKVDVSFHPHLQGPLYSPERLRRLIDDVGSPRVKVMLDPVNFINIDTYFDNTDFLNQMFDLLGDSIVGAHAKDVHLPSPAYTSEGRLAVLHIDEAIPGRGNLDYKTFLRRMGVLPRDTPLIIEHLSKDEEILEAKRYIEGVAQKIGVKLH